jgi:hypothetical protein
MLDGFPDQIIMMTSPETPMILQALAAVKSFNSTDPRVLQNIKEAEFYVENREASADFPPTPPLNPMTPDFEASTCLLGIIYNLRRLGQESDPGEVAALTQKVTAHTREAVFLAVPGKRKWIISETWCEVIENYHAFCETEEEAIAFWEVCYGCKFQPKPRRYGIILANFDKLAEDHWSEGKHYHGYYKYNLGY